MNTQAASSWAVAFILYHPPHELQQRLLLVKEAGIKTYVWLNSILPAGIDIAGCTVLNTSKENVGLAKAFNALFMQARADGFKKLLYFDQDTAFTQDSLRFVDAFLKQNGYPQDHAAIRFSDANGAHAHSMVGLEPKALLFSSGSLFNLESTASHNPSYFVEGVDYQFCLDAASKALSLSQLPCPGIDHEQQQPVQRYQLGQWQVDYRPYPWKRHKGFLWALIRLTGASIVAFQPAYAWRFARNLITHLAAQLQMLALNMLKGMGLAKKLLICNVLIQF